MPKRSKRSSRRPSRLPLWDGDKPPEAPIRPRSPYRPALAQLKTAEQLQRWLEDGRPLWICDHDWRQLTPEERACGKVAGGEIRLWLRGTIVRFKLFIDPSDVDRLMAEAAAAEAAAAEAAAAEAAANLAAEPVVARQQRKPGSQARHYKGRYQRMIMPFLKQRFPGGVDHSDPGKFADVRTLVVSEVPRCKEISDQTLRRNLDDYNATVAPK